ncbi:YqjF family protein [Echinicola sp. 20G]|uniref:YqjF family protein n=1 Tax=Echinicola sp. 20G TaxID=2781961 RepID=UPI00190FE6F1|nr:DUF2071 domain-containing protein [Echinicola sp. 20G]
MRITEILKNVEHRTFKLPEGNWSYYQEWNNAIFLHWKVDVNQLKNLVPEDLEIDLFENEAWVSVVAFTMERIRTRNLPSFPPISNFHELNIRTYVRYRGRPGVYFLSIEGGKLISCHVAKFLSDLPYRYSKIKRNNGSFINNNSVSNDFIHLTFKIEDPKAEKTKLEKWLTERYVLFQDTDKAINEFDIHHIEWPIYEVDMNEINFNYPKFKSLLNSAPNLKQYSPGVQVIAWAKKQYPK